jgi:hypothetical protein
MGNDISDYKDIDSLYGSLGDVDELLSQLKQRDMRLMKPHEGSQGQQHIAQRKRCNDTEAMRYQADLQAC